MSELSTAVTDAGLTASALIAATKSRSLLAFGGFGLVGLAAGVGTLRFAGSHQLIPLHSFLTEVSAEIGIPMIGLAFHLFAGRPSPGQTKLHDRSVILIGALLMAAVAARTFLLAAQLELYHTVMGLFSLGLIIRIAIKHKNNYALLGAAIFGASGLLGLSGSIGGINKADIFHIAAAVSFFLFSKAMRKLTF
eukprot:TRINITY_DN1820_c0_g1_i3.p1 TRINITY_DN1820_c0_g1~~TRINITY_DN1820_c0_g1_i3.p1  ORF type:complete len:193 (-),score=19.06 TRINITY_DN1820_c0_g1_i3:57-635(-)